MQLTSEESDALERYRRYRDSGAADAYLPEVRAAYGDSLNADQTLFVVTALAERDVWHLANIMVRLFPNNKTA